MLAQDHAKQQAEEVGPFWKHLNLAPAIEGVISLSRNDTMRGI